MSAFLSHRDAADLLERCIRIEGVQYAVVHGFPITATRVYRWKRPVACWVTPRRTMRSAYSALSRGGELARRTRAFSRWRTRLGALRLVNNTNSSAKPAIIAPITGTKL